MTKFLTKPIFFVLLACLAAAIGWGGIATVKVADLRTEIANSKARHDRELAEQADAAKDQLETLTTKNQEIQRDYLQTQKEFAAYRAGVARGDGVRNAERKEIVDAARSVAGACGRYAAAAERDIGAVEADAGRLGQEAHRASSAYSATRKTLDERRAAIEARRKALKSQEK